MRWRLFFICTLLYLAMLLAGAMGWQGLRQVLFWLLLIAVLLNFLAFALQVYRDNKQMLGKRQAGDQQD